MQSQRDQYIPQILNIARQLGIPDKYRTNARTIAALDINTLREILPTPEQADNVFNQIQNHIRQTSINIGNQAINHHGDDIWRKMAPKIRDSTPENFLLATHGEFFEDKNLIWGEVDPFQQAFGRVFTNYRELLHRNDRLEKYPPNDGSTRKHLSNSQFLEKHGIPPWDFVNQILETCHLDFRVEGPPLHETTPYEPKLQKISFPVEMRFQDLSSGERVLMSFALCLYNSEDNRQQKNFPKLLLLDEVDAPLHPSMTMSLLNTIQNVLVESKNVAVILTTHSPSTVALAPENSLYVMNPKGPAVEKISKNSALSILTTGVPTLSVSFDGRRQVFVESRTDASLYDALYQRYKIHLKSSRSLIFVEVGHKDHSGSETNAGCTQVIRLVESLAGGGNKSVFGLIDWDGSRLPKDRLHVLSENIRDGLESLLFDPVLLAATIARENSSLAREKGIFEENDSYAKMFHWDAARWQRAVGMIQNLVLNHNESADDTISVNYLNGMTLSISKKYLHMDDHALEEAIVSRFGFLKARNKHAGGLMRHVVDSVLADCPELLPNDFLDTLNALLDTELT